jgi:hypothetical protein
MSPTCRFCSTELSRSFADLRATPLANSYLRPDQLAQGEVQYPLHVFVCEECFLVQLPEAATPEEIFSEYAYFSSVSDSWVAHARAFTERSIERLGLTERSQVVEIASNDGYLLRGFVEHGVPVLGIEPAANVAEVAVAAGIPTRVQFFGTECAQELVEEGIRADLLVGNNVLAHVPDLNDVVAGLALLLAPTGTLSMEFPHLQRLVEENQFDTIYHEHFSYFSFLAVHRIFAAHGLEIYDVEELPTHGGSLRIAARHAEATGEVSEAVDELLGREEDLGYLSLDLYDGFAERVKETKRKLLEFLIEAKRAGKTIVGYGAPAKGNTLLNYCGVGTDFVDFTVDRSTYKQGLFLPGVRIPILAPEHIFETRPDYVLILPWNLREEIAGQMAAVREWGGRFVVAIPEVTVLP